MIVDASALLAILLEESDAGLYLQKLESVDEIWISPMNWWEVMVRVRRAKGEIGEKLAQSLISSKDIQVAFMGPADALSAFEASKKYGGRPARLNMGDCFAYVLAKQKDLPLLFKGNDFAATDVKVA